MTDNVLILGAGFSFDANIPLLGNFIERMWEYATRGKAGNKQLSEQEQKTLNNALDIRRELDNYHGRVSFDDRNLEDILSILAFNVLGGGKKDKDKLLAFIKAISTTIELSCDVKHEGFKEDGRFTANKDGNEIYRTLWKSLFTWHGNGNKLPSLITFNYDLVLERSLLQVLINTYYNQYKERVPFESFSLDYKYKLFTNQNYKIRYTAFGYESRNYGCVIEKAENIKDHNHLNIELLKLHGSLNFPTTSKSAKDHIPNLVRPVENPYIIPPVSNKQSSHVGDEAWRTALNRLQQAKNIIFVGYSLPKTDMYMQFFLKAALGPNQELNKITIFDPTLWKNNAESEEMRLRYEKCFAEQLRSRINFLPHYKYAARTNSSYKPGTTEHFIDTLNSKPDELLF